MIKFSIRMLALLSAASTVLGVVTGPADGTIVGRDIVGAEQNLRSAPIPPFLSTNSTGPVDTERRTSPPAVAASSKVPPFDVSIVGQTIPGRRDAWRLIEIRFIFARSVPGERFLSDCLACKGTTGRIRYRGNEAILVTHMLVTTKSRLTVYVSRRGMMGRFKEYTLRPRLRSHRLITEGCLAVNVYVRISCGPPAIAVEYVGPGTALGAGCPASPCLAVTRTTGYQQSFTGLTGISSVGHAGWIVAWEVALGEPAANQIAFFNEHEGGGAEAALAVLAPEPTSTFTYELVAQSPLVALQPHFGTVSRFSLEQPISVQPGDVLALTVPTWAPVLAIGFSAPEATWRSSRRASECAAPSESSSVMSIGLAVHYSCAYQTALLSYDAVVAP